MPYGQSGFFFSFSLLTGGKGFDVTAVGGETVFDGSFFDAGRSTVPLVEVSLTTTSLAAAFCV